MGKKIHAYCNQKTAGVVILISHKTDLQSNCYKRQRMALHIDKKAQIITKYNNFNHIYPKEENLKIYEAIINRIKGNISSTIVVKSSIDFCP